MSAKIIQTSQTPLKRVKVDPISWILWKTPCAMPGQKWMPYYFVLRCLRVFASSTTPSR